VPVVFPAGAASYVVTVADDDGGTSTMTVPLGVNRAPSIDVSGQPTTVAEGGTLNFPGVVVTDPDGDPLSYSWTSSAPPGTGTLTGASTPTPTFTAIDGPAITTIGLTVTDGHGASATTSFLVTITSVAPQVTITAPDTVPAGDPLELHAAITDSGNDTVTVAVDWGDGNTEPLQGPMSVPAASTVDHTYPAPGTFTVTVTVTDDDGAATVKTHQVVVTAAPITVDAGADASVAEGSSFTRTGTVTGPSQGASWTYQLSGFDAGAGCTRTPAGDPAVLTLSCTDDGTVTATLHASDLAGAEVTDTFVLTVTNSAPVVGTPVVPAGAILLGAPVTVTAPFSDAGTNDRQRTRLTWTDPWGSGSTPWLDLAAGAITASSTFVPDRPGLYVVTVWVEDDDGGSGSATAATRVVVTSGEGFVTGGGWFTDASGKTTLDVNIRNDKKDGPPDGHLDVRLADGRRIRSTAFDWLVIPNPGTAASEGDATIDGVAGYHFALVVDDGLRGPAVDHLRLVVADASGRVVALLDTDVPGGQLTVHDR